MITLLTIYIIGFVIAFLLLSYSASWFLNKSIIGNILLYSLLSWIVVVIICIIVLYDPPEIED